MAEASAESLQWIFQEYGEVTNARTLAIRIHEHARLQPIRTISDLKTVIEPVVKGNPHKYLAQVFQALRMAVNDEVGALKELLDQSVPLLRSGGRLAIITFHSIEDRMVKQFLKQGGVHEQSTDPLFGTRVAASMQPVNKKPIEPSVQEVKSNPRSRSARLRVGIRI